MEVRGRKGMGVDRSHWLGPSPLVGCGGSGLAQRGAAPGSDKMQMRNSRMDITLVKALILWIPKRKHLSYFNLA